MVEVNIRNILGNLDNLNKYLKTMFLSYKTSGSVPLERYWSKIIGC